MKCVKVLLIVLLSVVADSCGQMSLKQEFPFPEIPVMLESETQRAEYAVTHFWDKYFARHPDCDSATLREAFVKYASLINIVPVETGKKAQQIFAAQAERQKRDNPCDTLWNTLMALQKTIFFNPNSFYRNEDCYIPILENLVVSEFASQEQKTQAENILPYIRLNGVGTKAADFSFVLANGTFQRLYNIDSRYIILIFGNPGCNECKKIADILQSIPEYLIHNKIVAIVNIYTDENIEEWRAYEPNYPRSWINGYNRTILSESTYYLRAIPSVYLLDSAKTILAKDAPVEMIMKKLQGLL